MIHPQSSESILLKQPAVTTTFIFIGILIIVEWFQKHQIHGLYIGKTRFPQLARYVLYSAIIICLLWFGGKPAEFIYFQF
jgi:hypothetical protein